MSYQCPDVVLVLCSFPESAFWNTHTGTRHTHIWLTEEKKSGFSLDWIAVCIYCMCLSPLVQKAMWSVSLCSFSLSLSLSNTHTHFCCIRKATILICNSYTFQHLIMNYDFLHINSLRCAYLLTFTIQSIVQECVCVSTSESQNPMHSNLGTVTIAKDMTPALQKTSSR